jgi:hypothetical protein
VLASRHEDPSIEVVVETFPNYLVVQKFGEAGEVARSGRYPARASSQPECRRTPRLILPTLRGTP